MTIPLEKAGSHDAGAVQQHCPWGALANAPIVPDLPVLAAAPPAIEPVPAPVPSLGFAPGIASPLPPSAGPPFLACFSLNCRPRAQPGAAPCPFPGKSFQ